MRKAALWRPSFENWQFRSTLAVAADWGSGMKYQYRVATATVGTQELNDIAANMLNRYVQRGFVVDKVDVISNPSDVATLLVHYLLVPIEDVTKRRK
jgi:hypothetical protein